MRDSDDLRERGYPNGRKSDSRLIFGGWRWTATHLGMTSGSGLRVLPGGRKGKRGPRTNNRRFLNALLWMARSGSRWRDLPRSLGRREAVKRRYYRWIEMAVLDEILAALAREADLEWLMIDSTVVRAHQHAAGARRQKGGRTPRALVAPAEA
jgi:transposase